MYTKKTFTIQQIKKALINCCIHNNSAAFIPYLLSNNVEVSSPNKSRFYSCFKSFLYCAHKNKEGNLTLKIEKYKWVNDENIVYYNFYDEVHTYDRVSFEIKETNNKLHIDTMPF
ncbi:hypothetical protein SAMN04488096_10312 [Mesonia phycicola]|uniref:Uncharacterized protein n=1 Tax=Mesonia phycicola TaxID=579105 RepID=A0A1M6CIF6_9FLAO|nr:hypothetical protein [Mesonia phycicola]SHI60777.1 hypothetical protein SAMN04488096_10312 [Mesonia phycicola]